MRWKLVQSGVAYDGLRFDVHYTTSDYIEEDFLVKYTLYDGPECSSGANDITDMGFFETWLTGDTTLIGGGLGTREITLSTKIVAGTIAEAAVYIKRGKDVSIEFCIRFSLYNRDWAADPTATEINHHETKINLSVDLTDTFSITAQSVEAKDVGIETANDAFFVSGFLCSEDGVRLRDSVPFLQGQTVRVCVQPTQQAIDIGFRVRSIDRFTFVQGYVTQEAMINSRTSINGLTEFWCDEGSEQCIFETLLMAYFFRGPSTVDGDGTVTLQFGSGIGRRLGSYERQLQRSPKSLVLDTFPIQSYGYLLSSQYSGSTRQHGCMTTLLLALLVIVALLA